METVFELSKNFKGNIVLTYYTSQSFEKILLNIIDALNIFLQDNNICVEEYNVKAQCLLSNTKNIFDTKLDNANIEKPYKAETVGKIINYNDSIFLLPNKLKELLLPYKSKDVTEYKDIIQYIFLHDGYFKVRESHYKQLIQSVQSVISLNNINLKLYHTNNCTLRSLSKEIYTKNIEHLQEDICRKKIYESIIKLI
jgi:hypothetical protein